MFAPSSSAWRLPHPHHRLKYSKYGGPVFAPPTHVREVTNPFTEIWDGSPTNDPPTHVREVT